MPSLRRIILLDRRESSNFMFPALEALKFAVYFAAVCTFSEPECQQRFQEGRDKVSDKFRLATEVMLCRASLQTTKDITVLQAFAIYLVSYPCRSSI